MYMGLENGTVQLVEMMDRFHAIEDFLGFRYTSNVDCAKKESICLEIRPNVLQRRIQVFKVH